VKNKAKKDINQIPIQKANSVKLENLNQNQS